MVWYSVFMTILAVDFMNQAHRARSGFSMGPAPVIFNFFRNLKSLVDKFTPNRVYIALEGRPVKRYEALPEYKATRKVEESDPKYEELKVFFNQVDVIVDLLSRRFPVSVVRHPTFECDDTIANLVMNSSSAVPWVIVSNDSDFTQLLHDHENLQIWNPMKKEFVVAPTEYDYAIWKALRGDGSDNIPGVPGVGDKTAAKIASDPALLKEYTARPEVRDIFARNYDLIRFKGWSPEEEVQMTSSSPTKDWDEVKEVFTSHGFKSIVKDGSWEKFIASFDSLWT